MRACATGTGDFALVAGHTHASRRASAHEASTAVRTCRGFVLILLVNENGQAAPQLHVQVGHLRRVRASPLFGDDSGPGRGGASCPYSTHRKQTTMHTRNSPDYQRTLRRWAELLRLQDERGLTVQEGRELRTLHAQLHAAEASSLAALTDDYAETMLREAGHIGGCEW